jgi:elongation factor Ts
MANFTAADIKALREQTGAGMLDVKNALNEADGDRTTAVEILRVKGLRGVTKREGRSASDGLVAAHVADGVGTLVEINCETDFVAKSGRFKDLAQQVLDAAVAVGAGDVPSLLAAPAGGETVEALVTGAAATLGEKVQVRRVARLQGEKVASYLHRTNPDLPPQIGVLVATSSDAGDIGKDVAMHAAAMAPIYLSRDDVPADTVASERRIAEETAREEGKPEQALPKIIEGRVNGFFKENVLLDQSFAKDAKKSVKQVVSEAGTEITAFARFRVGS